MPSNIKALKVATQILWIAHQDGRLFTPMQLIKLTYIAHGWTLGLLEKSLFADTVEAWKYGPVIPEVYHKYKRFGYSHISVRLKDSRTSFDQVPYSILNRVVDEYGKYDGLHLSGLTHQPGSPWDLTIKQHGEGAPISSDVIHKYYKDLSQQ